jgi:ATP/maltotriose-dependent transcriptional regulator MalT
VAWLSLDPDDDEQRFWAYLLAASWTVRTKL